MGITDFALRLVGISRKRGGKHYEPQLLDLKELLGKAESSIKIVAGEACYSAYSALREELEQALERECNVEVILWKKANKKSVNALESLGIPVFKARPTTGSPFCCGGRETCEARTTASARTRGEGSVHHP